MAERPDADLLEAWRKGDPEAGEELFDRHFKAISRFFRNKTRTGVEDLIQQTFLTCIETQDRFRGDSTFRTYLFGVANNVLRNHYRTMQRSGERMDFLHTSVHDLAPGPSTLVSEKAEEMLLLEGLRQIPIDHQVLLEFYYWEHLTAAEIARVMDVPEGTVRTRLRRAKQLLEARVRTLATGRTERVASPGGLDEWAANIRKRLLGDD